MILDFEGHSNIYAKIKINKNPLVLLISFSDCSTFQSMFIADLSSFSTESKPTTQIPLQDQPRPSKDSVQLHFPIPKPTLSAFKSDVATTTSTAAIPSMSKGIVFYQVKRDHGVFDPKKIDFSTLTLPSLVKNSEAKSK